MPVSEDFDTGVTTTSRGDVSNWKVSDKIIDPGHSITI